MWRYSGGLIGECWENSVKNYVFNFLHIAIAIKGKKLSNYYNVIVNSHQLSLDTVTTERSLQLVKEATERETRDEKKTMREREKEMKEWNVK